MELVAYASWMLRPFPFFLLDTRNLRFVSRRYSLHRRSKVDKRLDALAEKIADDIIYGRH